jgi:serine/threonine-protein kinase
VDSSWTFVPSDNGGIRLSPNGHQLALGVIVQGREEVWIKQLDHGPFARLTLESSSERPEWSADGRDILYAGLTGSSRADLRRSRADGTGTAELLLHASRAVWEVQVPRDTSRIIVRLGVPPTRDIYLLDRARGTGDSAISPLVADDRYEEAAVALSPDGRWLAYGSNESGRYEVYVRPFPDVNAGRWQISVKGGNEPRWAHSGRELFYRDAGGDLVSVEVTTASGFRPGSQRVLFSASGFTTNSAYSNYDVGPDDRRFVFLRPLAVASAGVTTAILVQHWTSDLQAQASANR